MMVTRPAVLRELGARVRSRRGEQKLSIRALAERSGLSPRFLSELEAGRANISILRLVEVAEALATNAGDLLVDAERGVRALGHEERLVVSLVGLRGAGKSTIGPLLASRLMVPFFELDHFVERAAGMALSELFSFSGQEYYRELELEALRRFLDGHERAVLATGGGIVAHPAAFELLSARTVTVWLRATVEDHWNRVIVHQGDTRPSAGIPHAKRELARILRTRKPLYERCRRSVDTTRLGIEGSVSTILRFLGYETSTERSRRRKRG